MSPTTGRTDRAVPAVQNRPSTATPPSEGTMLAIVHSAYGSADVLRLEQVDRPTIKDDEVLLRVHAAGLDRGAWHFMAGQPYAIRLVTGFRRPRTPGLGLDVAGTVVAVGPKV